MPTWSTCTSNNYIIRCYRRLGWVGIQRQAEFSSSCSHSSSSSRSSPQDAVVRASARQRAWALRTPVEETVMLWSREELWVNMLQSVPVSNSPLTHNRYQPFRNPFENEVWEVYFSKEVCSFVIIVDYVSACICIHIVLSWLYNICMYVFIYVLEKKLEGNWPQSYKLYWMNPVSNTR